MKKTFFLILIFLAVPVASFALQYKGIEPGISARSDVEKVFGPAKKMLGDNVYEYVKKNGKKTVRVQIEFVGGGG